MEGEEATVATAKTRDTFVEQKEHDDAVVSRSCLILLLRADSQPVLDDPSALSWSRVVATAS